MTQASDQMTLDAGAKALAAARGDSPAAPTLAPKRGRAPHGQIQKQVLRVISHAPEGILQGDIAGRGVTMGYTIKPSSMRMALTSLSKSGEIERRDGKWFPKGNGAPTGAPPLTQQSAEAADDAARKEGGT